MLTIIVSVPPTGTAEKKKKKKYKQIKCHICHTPIHFLRAWETKRYIEAYIANLISVYVPKHKQDAALKLSENELLTYYWL